MELNVKIENQSCLNCFKFIKDENTERDGFFFGICKQSYEKELTPQDAWCTRWNKKN